MKPISLCLAVLFLVSSLTMVAAQETSGYVDVKETNKRIVHLQNENENHENTIAANKERKSFLESRAETSETRLGKIEENLEYARKTNLELNAINSETRDRETKKRLEASRSELMNVIWILTNEQTFLTVQTDEDMQEIEFLARDTARRETLIERNEEEIAELQRAVAATESKINEISSKLDTVISRLDGLRDEVTLDM